MDSPLLPIPDAGRFLGYTGKSSGKTSIYQHISSKRLTAVRIKGRTFVTRESAERLIQNSLTSGGRASSVLQKGDA